jgi:hypothetical protein
MPALLVVVATFGVARSVGLDQSSWQGASFGMFATYDNRTSRHVRVTVDSAGQDEPVRVQLPAELEDDAERLRVLPSAAAARRLAAETLERVPEGKGERVVVEVRRLKIELRGGGGLRVGVALLAFGDASR